MSMSKKNTPPNGVPVEVLYAVSSGDVSHLEGKLLTIVDASIGDPEQRRALKDIIRQNVWGWALDVPRRCKTEHAKYTFSPTPDFIENLPSTPKGS